MKTNIKPSPLLSYVVSCSHSVAIALYLAYGGLPLADVDSDFSTRISPESSTGREDDRPTSSTVLFIIWHAQAMRRGQALKDAQQVLSKTTPRLPLVQVSGGTFFRHHPSAVQDISKNPPLFPNLTFELHPAPEKKEDRPKKADKQHSPSHWAVISAKGGTTFLEILRGAHFCEPLQARSFPYLSSGEFSEQNNSLRLPTQAIQYVGFNPGKGSNSLGAGVKGAYLSARYESRRLTAEETDWTVRQYLTGQTEQNPSENLKDPVDNAVLAKTVADLRLQKLLDMPVSNLSNGQTRRARIAKALLGKPLLLLLDDPFMGLDPPTLVRLSPMLRDLAYASSPLLLLALRPQDPIPDWMTHLVVLGDDNKVSLMGPKDSVLLAQHVWGKHHHDPQMRRGQDGITPTRMADEMTKRYGAPLQGMTEILTDDGVYEDDTYDRILTSEGAYNNDGIIRRSHVPPELKEHYKVAVKSKVKDLSFEDLRLLTTTVPQQLHDLGSASSLRRKDVAVESLETATKKAGLGAPLIELESVVIKYGDKVVLGHPPPQPGHDIPGLNITISEGTRLALLGPNGSGKTTFLSLLTSDHPQSYSLPIKFFGRSRLPEPGKPGLSMWEIQARVGHSSPEVHSFFPKHLNIRQVLESAWAETYISKPKLSHARDEMVDAFLRWWEPELCQDFSLGLENVQSFDRLGGPQTHGIQNLVESTYPPVITAERQWSQDYKDGEEPKIKDDLDWAEDDSLSRFGVLPFGTQRLLLLLRALIKQPDVLILDEAFSGLSPEVRDKAMAFLEYGETKFLFDMPDLDVVRYGHSIQFDPPPRESTSLRSNTRVALNLLLKKNNLELNTVIHNRNFNLTSIRKKTKEQLIAEAEEYYQTHAVDALSDDQDFRFKGLTEKQAMVVVSHIKEEVPDLCDEFVRLPGEEEVSEEGRGIEMGYVGRGGVRKRWGWVWRAN